MIILLFAVGQARAKQLALQGITLAQTVYSLTEARNSHHPPSSKYFTLFLPFQIFNSIAAILRFILERCYIISDFHHKVLYMHNISTFHFYFELQVLH